MNLDNLWQSMTIYDNLWQSWTSKAPSGKPILAVRESIKSSLVSPPMPLTRYSARSTMPSSSSSWTKPCLAQLGNRSAEQVAPLSIASCQIPGHQWFVICSMRTLAHLRHLRSSKHAQGLRAHRNLLRLSLPHLYRFLSHSFPFYVLRVSACIFPSAPRHWNSFCAHSIPFPHFSQSLPTLMILMPAAFLAFVPCSPIKMLAQGLSVKPTLLRPAIIPKEQLVDISGRPAMLAFNL